MEPAVRSPRTESAIIPDTAKILCIENLQFSEPPTVITARKIQPPGTEFFGCRDRTLKIALRDR
jgi:hypothetical protein